MDKVVIHSVKRSQVPGCSAKRLQHMKRLLTISIASASIAIGAIPALAEVDSKTHKLCLEAKDYAGCVRAMKGDLTPSQRLINVQGASETEGNACPDGMAFAGGSTCKSIKCVISYKANESELILKGKGWKCKKHLMQIAANVPVYGDVSERTFVNHKYFMELNSIEFFTTRI